MAPDAFVIRFENEGSPFTAQFLAADFDITALKRINRELGLPTRSVKNELIQQIASIAGDQKQDKALSLIIEELIARQKTWVSIKIGNITHLPQCANPFPMVYSVGQEGWYGPITCQFDDAPGTYWYIRQKHIQHYEIAEDNQVKIFNIRWLVFARIRPDSISLHWRNFSHKDTEDATSRHNIQFPYWRHIPGIFDEIQDMTRASLQPIVLHDLILYGLWDIYRDAPGYEWIDERVRAESSGITFNAHAGKIYDINTSGLMTLSRTLRKSIEVDLGENEMKLPDPEHIDDVILRTLIREYGTLSYEFSLKQQQQTVFRAHAYFGSKQHSDSQDCFPHLYFHISTCPYLKQLESLLQFLQNGRIPDANDQHQQLPMLE